MISLSLLVVAVLVQTTVFHLWRPFGEVPELVLLMVIVCARWFQPESAVLLGFTGGLMVDLFGTTPFGLHALAYTLVAYATVRISDRFDYGLHITVPAVGVITFVGLSTIALVGTLFGERTLGSTGIARTLILVPFYNMLLGIVALPLTNGLFRSSRHHDRYGTPATKGLPRPRRTTSRAPRGWGRR